MNVATLRASVLNLALLTALAVGGWFLGAALIASGAGTADPVLVAADGTQNASVEGRLILPRSGLSPFGHHAGLEGRQLLVGRVTAVDALGFTAQTPAGEVTFTFLDSPFLLRLTTVAPDLIGAGAAVALLLDADASGALIARALIALPVVARPQISATAPGPGAAGTDSGDGS